jgi:catechol 2,3-dioxygenase-like lactoylglutathione lyase family enzyme
MLGEHPIAPVLLAEDLAAAREFYYGKLGLQIERENESAIVFKCGSGTHLDVTKSTTGTADQQTQAAWQVSDIRAVSAGRLVDPAGGPAGEGPQACGPGIRAPACANRGRLAGAG